MNQRPQHKSAVATGGGPANRRDKIWRCKVWSPRAGISRQPKRFILILAATVQVGWITFISPAKGNEFNQASFNLPDGQQLVGSFDLSSSNILYETWLAGDQRRCYADELLPACFERTLVVSEISGSEPLCWIFTGPRAGITLLLTSKDVRFTHRFYDSPGFFDVAGKPARHPEWTSPEKRFALSRPLSNLTVRLDSKLGLTVLANGQQLYRQEWQEDLSRHQVNFPTAKGAARGHWMQPNVKPVTVRVIPSELHQTMLGFGGITTPTAYALLSEEGKQRWWPLLAEYNLLIQREYPNGVRLNAAMDNWDRLADASPHYYGDNFPNGEISNFAYNRRLRELGGQVWFEFWKLPPWVGLDVQKYADAVVNYCRVSRERAGGPPEIVGIQNELRQKPEQWRSMTLALRHALDEAGFASVRIHMADAGRLRNGIEFIKDFRRFPEAWKQINYTASHLYDFQDVFNRPDDFDSRIAEWNALTDGKPFLSTELCVNSASYQTDSYRLALAMGQLYHKNLAQLNAVAICYCWTLLNVVQPSYGATRCLFVPDERNGFVPVASSQQLRAFGAFSRRIHRGMTRLGAISNDPDLLVCAFVAENRATLVALNRSTRSISLKVDWADARFTTCELADPYHQNFVQRDALAKAEYLVPPGAIVTLSNVELNSLPEVGR